MLCRRAGFEPNVVQEASGLLTLLGLVAAGMGLTVLTGTLSTLHPDKVVFRPLDNPGALSRLWLIHRAAPSIACQRFIGLLRQSPGLSGSPGCQS